MGAEQDSLEQKLPASVVKALQLFMERSFWNKWAEVTETHLQAPAQQFDPDFIRKLIPKMETFTSHFATEVRHPKFATWVKTASGVKTAGSKRPARSSQPGSRRPARSRTRFARCRSRRYSTLSSAAPSTPWTCSTHPGLHTYSSQSCISSTPDMHERASKPKNRHSITELLTWGSPFAKTKMPGYP